MPRLPLLLCALLLSVQPAAAATITIDVTDFYFVESGTDTICLQCADADPLNDFKAALIVNPVVPVAPWPFIAPWSAFLDFTGTTLTDFTNIDLHLAIDLSVALDGVPTYFGSLTGALFGVTMIPGAGVTYLVSTCCSGDVGPVMVVAHSTPNSPQPFTLPPYTNVMGMEVRVAPTAVPEPMTLLLLGGGLVAGWRRRRR